METSLAETKREAALREAAPLRPPSNYCIGRPIEVKKLIYTPESESGRPDRVEVLKVGPGFLTPEGRMEMSTKPGDIVLLAMHGPEWIPLTDGLLLFSENDIRLYDETVYEEMDRATADFAREPSPEREVKGGGMLIRANGAPRNS